MEELNEIAKYFLIVDELKIRLPILFGDVFVNFYASNRHAERERIEII